MLTQRTRPRLNISFPDYDLIDKLEIAARGTGEELFPFIRSLLNQGLQEKKKQDIIDRAAEKCLFRILKMLEIVYGDEVARKAESSANDFLDSVEKYVRHTSD